MGCPQSVELTEELKEQQRRSDELAKELKRDVNSTKNVHKILLLGAGGCGKSTIMKQMKKINDGDNKDEKELQMFAQIVRNNLLTAVHSIAVQSTKMSVFELEKKTILPLVKRFQALDQKKIDEISRSGLDNKEAEEWAQSIDTFWNDAVIQQVYDRGNEYNLLESAKYFIATVGARKILPKTYVPDHLHIVHSRKATEAITEYTFVDKDKGAKITLVDVGGQRDRRKKWIRCFEHVTCILFIASLSDYDMNLEEDVTRNRMLESIDLFYGVRDLEIFKKTPIVVFLNKHDKFCEKIGRSELPFEDYEGDKHDPEAAYKYIEAAFRGEPPDDDMYIYKTVAVDENNITKVWNTVRDVVMNKNMVDFGMIAVV
mmetsp:Transcript_36974/g.68239  ORF Transcript_36974/g.68239 Transcript_36974/m.68239 type:complete len:372 (-) Transcript_36974:95-1210(-)|eukprot:CAMPEP_0170171928 /NCGR_PEP_ID=MMETSP0040_2-20121228/5135_1 /TAXON_ID=641309 /ORGANISM="Lotharella oceanica, Strain CCMP622" /LENGTH=371 /DNA_ID=CAMNT_0010412289 /DNA_START=55 /DNA_END=1170 /DNA_ORIENTATION=-